MLLGAAETEDTGVCIPGVVGADGGLAGVSVMVDWDEEREKALEMGARCVSLSSIGSQRDRRTGTCAAVGVTRIYRRL